MGIRDRLSGRRRDNGLRNGQSKARIRSPATRGLTLSHLYTERGCEFEEGRGRKTEGSVEKNVMGDDRLVQPFHADLVRLTS